MLSGGVQEALFLLPTHFPTFLKSLKPKLGPTKPGNHFFNQNYSLYNLMGVGRGCVCVGGGFTGGSVVKNLPPGAGDMGSVLDPGRSHMWGATKPVRHNY